MTAASNPHSYPVPGVLRDWDEFVASARHGYHEQTSLYGAMRRHYGFACHRIVQREAGQIVGGVQLLVQRTPIGRLARALRGPITLDDDPAQLSKIIELIDREAMHASYAAVRVDLLPTQHALRETLRLHGYEPNSGWEGEHPSFVIPLQRSDDQLLAGIRRKTRYNIRRTLRAGVNVNVQSQVGISEFYRLYMCSSRHHGFVPFPQQYFEYLWNLFSRHDRAMICSAHLGDTLVAALINVVSGGRLYPSWIGIDRDLVSDNLQVASVMYYETMKWGRDRGCELLDFQDALSNKRLFTKEEIIWPAPLRKFFGRAGGLRRRVFDVACRSPRIKRLVTSAAHRLGFRPRMPY